VAPFRQVKGSPSPTPGRCDHAPVTQSTGTRAAMGPHPGFRVSFWFRLGGCGVSLLVITRGTLSLPGLGLCG
jgi:hypothetical protein